MSNTPELADRINTAYKEYLKDCGRSALGVHLFEAGFLAGLRHARKAEQDHDQKARQEIRSNVQKENKRQTETPWHVQDEKSGGET